ncbi:MAG: hypothetical protein C0432_05145 [Candidatus Puniceispirillum sp.]|nr:hypothetical protein [Candidatus Pelagibacter sp.]MBA4283661.1 hypothetical protein [Candidatus Puniceispirillum sp.]
MHQKLLNWYNQNARILPWRVDVFEKTNPYHIMVSEFMLQQTTIATVIPYFNRFIEKFPTVNHLASSSVDDVLLLWQGLGYYRRAKNLHFASQQIINLDFFPKSYDELLQLKGVGDYTAAAIASIGFNQPVIPVDGNVKRVWSRFYGIDIDSKNIKLISQQFTLLMQGSEAFAFKISQALMELGATVCMPKVIMCNMCPLKKSCKAFENNTMSEFPKPKKLNKPKQFDLNLFLVTDSQKQKIMIKKNPEQGLFANMYFLPSNLDERVECLNKDEDCLLHQFKHILSHYHFNVSVYHSYSKDDHSCFNTDKEVYHWISLTDRKKYSFPKLIAKALDAL